MGWVGWPACFLAPALEATVRLFAKAVRKPGDSAAGVVLVIFGDTGGMGPTGDAGWTWVARTSTEGGD